MQLAHWKSTERVFFSEVLQTIKARLCHGSTSESMSFWEEGRGTTAWQVMEVVTWGPLPVSPEQCCGYMPGELGGTLRVADRLMNSLLRTVAIAGTEMLHQQAVAGASRPCIINQIGPKGWWAGSNLRKWAPTLRIWHCVLLCRTWIYSVCLYTVGLNGRIFFSICLYFINDHSCIYSQTNQYFIKVRIYNFSSQQFYRYSVFILY